MVILAKLARWAKIQNSAKSAPFNLTPYVECNAFTKKTYILVKFTL
jgi:hypothetical protein